MVVASVSTEAERFELKTLEGGYIELKPLSHGQKLRRREIATNQSMKGLGGKNDNAELAIEMAQRAAQVFDYKNCIVKHNLERLVQKPNTDDVLVPMDFSDPNTIDSLNPRVGDEIDMLIDSLNNFDDGGADGSGN